MAWAKLVVILIFLFAIFFKLETRDPSKREIYEEALKYTVFIRSDGAKKDQRYILPIKRYTGERLLSGIATGIVIQDENGKPLIVTQNHVVENNDKNQIFYVWFYGYPNYQPIRKIGCDELFDWAILEFVDKDFRPPGFAKIGSNQNTRVEDSNFFIMGNPERLSTFFVETKLSNKTVEYPGNHYRPMAFEAFCTRGFSGGPVINSAGEVIGLLEFILDTLNSPCFVSPIEIFKNLYPKLKAGGKVQHGTIGVAVANIHEFTPNELHWLHVKKIKESKGVIIVSKPTPHAKAAGLNRGDILLGVKLPGGNWFEAKSTEEFNEVLQQNFFLDDSVTLKIKRGEKVMIKTIRMIVQPDKTEDKPTVNVHNSV